MRKVNIDRYLLVDYTCVSGEYEFNGHTVLTLESKEKADKHVHEFFQDFYAYLEKDETEKCNYYLYNGGEVAVKDIGWKEITLNEYKILKKLGIAC